MDSFEIRNDILTNADTERFRDVISGYFKTKAPEPDVVLSRRPRIVTKLPHGDYVFTVRPYWQRKTVDCERMTVEALYEGSDLGERRGKIRATNFVLSPGNARITMLSARYVDDAIMNFMELARFFPIMPWTCFAKSNDFCCVCGRGLTDPLSMARGIGPECLGRVTAYFGQPDYAGQHSRHQNKATVTT
jgi:hypothetical protein